MREPTVGDFILNYQLFRDDDDPSPPFLCRILKDSIRLWTVEHVNNRGIIKVRRINKGCCSTTVVNPDTVMKDWKNYFVREVKDNFSKAKVQSKPQKRVRLKL